MYFMKSLITPQHTNRCKPKSPGQEQPQTENASTSSIENLSGLLGFETRGENPEEEAFIRKIKRKKKRKRKL